ncbi:MAG: DUF4388 domain-containing protein [candidate division WOR-3 bacterium]|uniref:DUF4388 domain-containing protein n=1 Tax=candidate division WOR-3 bacterium TaxID=2052148 RepID=A0A7V3ZSU2_UNCW3
MTLRGNLKDFELGDLLQLLHMSLKNGALKISSPMGEGVIYVENGIIRHVELGEEEGEIAMAKIMQWKEGTFEFLKDVKSQKNTINLPIPNLLLEIARKIDEWKVIEKVVPSMDAIFEIEPNPDTDVEEIELRQNEWKILSRIDGKKSVREVAEYLNMEPFETAKIFYGLATSGLIRLKQKPVEEKKEKKEEEKEGKGFMGFFKKKK